MAERERPWQRLRPMALQDMQVGAAHPAGPDLDQRRLLSNLRPRHGAHHRPCARAVISADADVLHEASSGPSLVVHSVTRAEATECDMSEDNNPPATPLSS